MRAFWYTLLHLAVITGLIQAAAYVSSTQDAVTLFLLTARIPVFFLYAIYGFIIWAHYDSNKHVNWRNPKDAKRLHRAKKKRRKGSKKSQ